jgi:hypothetical protein
MPVCESVLRMRSPIPIVQFNRAQGPAQNIREICCCQGPYVGVEAYSLLSPARFMDAFGPSASPEDQRPASKENEARALLGDRGPKPPPAVNRSHTEWTRAFTSHLVLV